MMVLQTLRLRSRAQESLYARPFLDWSTYGISVHAFWGTNADTQQSPPAVFGWPGLLPLFSAFKEFYCTLGCIVAGSDHS